MKKLLGVLLIGVFALAISASAITPGKISIGIDSAAGNLLTNNVGALTVGYNITDAIEAKLGLNYSNGKVIGGAENSQTGISARVGYVLPVAWGAANPVIGVQYSADGATTATSIISLVLGVRAEVADGVVLGAGLLPYSQATMSGASDSSMNTGTDNQNGRSIYISAAVDLN